jgi:Fe-S cluster assembly protein SufD
MTPSCLRKEAAEKFESVKHQAKCFDLSCDFLSEEEKIFLKGAPEDLVVVPLEEAFSSYSAFLSRWFQKTIALENDPFFLLNTAQFSSGLFIYVPQGLEASTIHLGSHSSIPKVTIFCGKRSKTTFEIENGSASSCASYEFFLDEGAICTAIEAPMSKNGTIFSNIFCEAREGSSFSFHAVQQGMCCKRTGVLLHLGKEAKAEVSTLSIGKEKEKLHVDINAFHEGEKSSSKISVKNVLFDAAEASCKTCANVRREAAGSTVATKSQTLLLSPDAKISTKPFLNIDVDDVVATHGATSGPLDEEELFYLLCRGISQKEAEDLLIQGFCQKELHEKLKPYLSR